MLLYFGSITILPEANGCLCDTGHIWPQLLAFNATPPAGRGVAFATSYSVVPLSTS
jgi:hypothetical protein